MNLSGKLKIQHSNTDLDEADMLNELFLKYSHLSEVVEAVKCGFVLELIYETYMETAPVCLKEFENHWYLMEKRCRYL